MVLFCVERQFVQIQNVFKIKELTLPFGLEEIRYGAFVGVKNIHIPESVTGIETDAIVDFDDNSVTIYGKTGSAAEQYAIDANIAFIAE